MKASSLIDLLVVIVLKRNLNFSTYSSPFFHFSPHFSQNQLPFVFVGLLSSQDVVLDYFFVILEEKRVQPFIREKSFFSVLLIDGSINGFFFSFDQVDNISFMNQGLELVGIAFEFYLIIDKVLN
jgi:hypothetical protein